MSVDVDEADVAVLEENLIKTRKLVGTITSSLELISSRSLSTSSKIKPIIDKANQLNIYKRNISEGLSILSQVQEYAERGAKNEIILNGSVDSTGLKKYIQTLNASQSLLKEISNNVGDFKGVVINLDTSCERAMMKLRTYLKNIMKTISSPFDLSKLKKEQVIPLIPNNKLKDIITITEFFSGANESSMDKLYIEARSNYVLESLKVIEASTKPVSRSSKVPYEKGSNGISNYTSCLIKLINAEHVQITEMFKHLPKKGSTSPEHYFDSIFDQPINSTYCKIVNSITGFVEQNLTSDGALLVECIENIVQLQNALNDISLYKLSRFSQLNNELQSATTLGKSLFIDLLSFIENKIVNLEKLPNDNGVCEVTVELMSRMRKVAEYREPSLRIMRNVKIGSWIPHPKPAWITSYSSVLASGIDEENSKDLLSSFFSDAIDDIIINLELKAKLVMKKPTMGYFLITNLTLVEQIVNRSELHKILSGIGFERLEKLKKRALNYFLEGWKMAASNLMDVTIVAGSAGSSAGSGSSKITGKEKDALKEKFRNFNESFEELVKTHKSYNITDPNLRKFLCKEVSFIGPLYHRFYDKYGDGAFTKNVSKYIKYDKQSFDRVIDSLA